MDEWMDDYQLSAQWLFQDAIVRIFQMICARQKTFKK